jgi:hypothetical protein
VDEELIFKILLGLFIIFNLSVINILFFKKIMDKKDDADEERLEMKDVDFNNFNIEQDIYSLNYITTLMATEYVDNNIMNANENKSGHKRIEIPNTDDKHQNNVDDITTMVMNVISDEHIMYLKKYVNISRLKYLVRIYVKRVYNELINEAVQHRIKAIKEAESGMESDNSNKEVPGYIKEILDEYGMDVQQARREALRTKVDENKIKTTKPDSEERQYYNDIKRLNNYFKNN